MDPLEPEYVAEGRDPAGKLLGEKLEVAGNGAGAKCPLLYELPGG